MRAWNAQGTADFGLSSANHDSENRHTHPAADVSLHPNYIMHTRRNRCKTYQIILAQLRTLEVQLDEELKKHHFLSISKAREQILHIAFNAGI